MVRVRYTVNECIERRQEGALRAYNRGEPSNLTPEQRRKWLEGIYKG